MQDFQDRAVATEEVEGLKVFVVGRVVRGREGGDLFPRYGPYRIYREATRGKVGGLGDGEGF